MALFSVADKAAETYWLAVEGEICHYRRPKFGLRSRNAIQSNSKERGKGSEGLSAFLNKGFPGFILKTLRIYGTSLSLSLHSECF